MSPMSKCTFGISAYVSHFENQKSALISMRGKGIPVFTSFHIQEEWDSEPHYAEKATDMCRWLKQYGFKIIGDVSPRTLQFFQKPTLIALAEFLQLDVLRIDYGFSEDEIRALADLWPLAFNASTANLDALADFVASEKEIFGMHNFYPRPETGLDNAFFSEINTALHASGLKSIAFIPGDAKLRGPLFEGLPTLETHRYLPPYVAFLDLAIRRQVDAAFLGDIALSEHQYTLIDDYLNTGVIAIPALLASCCRHLYRQVFTVRRDSPANLLRLKESREYATQGDLITPGNCIERVRGSITMDNIGYKRYSGEIQILKTDFPQDDRVNVIGKIDPSYESLLDIIPRGAKIKWIEPNF